MKHFPHPHPKSLEVQIYAGSYSSQQKLKFFSKGKLELLIKMDGYIITVLLDGYLTTYRLGSFNKLFWKQLRFI